MSPSLGSVSRETELRLKAYVDLLLAWNHTINLISRGDEAHVWSRHIEDSLGLLPNISPAIDRAIDLGSGGGFPGLVIAIAANVSMELVESDQRKAAFLREAARVTGAPVSVHATRIESTILKPAMLVTARALAPLPKLIGWAERFVAPGGYCLFPKGREAQAELTAAASQWHMSTQSLDGPGGSKILRISEITRVQHSS